MGINKYTFLIKVPKVLSQCINKFICSLKEEDVWNMQCTCFGRSLPLVSDFLKFPDKSFSKEYPNNVRCGCGGQSSLYKGEAIVIWKTLPDR